MLTSTEMRFILDRAREEGRNWDKPLKFNDVIVPIFPYECLPSKLSDFVKAVADNTQTSIDMSSVAGLISLAVCLQGKFVIQGSKGYIEPLNLYGVIVSPPGTRKSSVMKAMTKYIYQYEQEENQKNKPLIDESNMKRNILSEQIKELETRASRQKGDWKLFKDQAMDKKKELLQIQEIKPLRLIADDVSPEALTSLLAENNGKMAVISAEGGIFDILAGRYSNSVNIDTFLKAHAGDSLRVDRKGRQSEYINSPSLSILLAIQPQVLEGIMDNVAFRGRGLIARFLFCQPASNIGTRKFIGNPVPFEYEQDFKELISYLLNIPCKEEPEVIRLSSEASILIKQEFDSIEKRLLTDLESISEWASKYIGVVLRIAGLLHIAENRNNSKLVSSETMINAIEIGHYFIEQAKLVFSIMGANETQKQAMYILKQIQKEYNIELSKRDIFNLCRGRIKKVEHMDKGLELLEEYGYIQRIIQVNNSAFEENKRGRKPSIAYAINPYLYEKSNEHIEQITHNFNYA